MIIRFYFQDYQRGKFEKRKMKVKMLIESNLYIYLYQV